MDNMPLTDLIKQIKIDVKLKTVSMHAYKNAFAGSFYQTRAHSYFSTLDGSINQLIMQPQVINQTKQENF